jgi:hypothetical protein
MTIGFLVIWLLVGIDIAGDGPWTPTDPTLAGEDLVATMDGPTLPPPPLR